MSPNVNVFLNITEARTIVYLRYRIIDKHTYLFYTLIYIFPFSGLPTWKQRTYNNCLSVSIMFIHSRNKIHSMEQSNIILNVNAMFRHYYQIFTNELSYT